MKCFFFITFNFEFWFFSRSAGHKVPTIVGKLNPDGKIQIAREKRVEALQRRKELHQEILFRGCAIIFPESLSNSALRSDRMEHYFFWVSICGRYGLFGETRLDILGQWFLNIFVVAFEFGQKCLSCFFRITLEITHFAHNWISFVRLGNLTLANVDVDGVNDCVTVRIGRGNKIRLLNGRIVIIDADVSQLQENMSQIDIALSIYKKIRQKII